MIRDLEYLFHGGRLKELGQFCLEKRSRKEHLTVAFQYLEKSLKKRTKEKSFLPEHVVMEQGRMTLKWKRVALA